MSEKPKTDNTTKRVIPKRPSTVSVPTSSRPKILSKEKTPTQSKKNNQVTPILEHEKEYSFPEFDDKYRENVYSRFLSDVLTDCAVQGKIERDETPVELLMTQLAERFKKTIHQLDKTSKRLKDISFDVEEKRLLDLKDKHSKDFYNESATGIFEDIPAVELAYLSKANLTTDVGFNKNSGHRQLIDTVNDAIVSLEKIKNESNLDLIKFQDESKEDHEEDDLKFDVESIKSEFEAMFPKISQRLLQEASERIAKIIDEDFEEQETDDD